MPGNDDRLFMHVDVDTFTESSGSEGTESVCVVSIPNSPDRREIQNSSQENPFESPQADLLLSRFYDTIDGLQSTADTPSLEDSDVFARTDPDSSSTVVMESADLSPRLASPHIAHRPASLIKTENDRLPISFSHPWNNDSRPPNSYVIAHTQTGPIVVPAHSPTTMDNGPESSVPESLTESVVSYTFPRLSSTNVSNSSSSSQPFAGPMTPEPSSMHYVTTHTNSSSESTFLSENGSPASSILSIPQPLMSMSPSLQPSRFTRISPSLSVVLSPQRLDSPPPLSPPFPDTPQPAMNDAEQAPEETHAQNQDPPAYSASDSTFPTMRAENATSSPTPAHMGEYLPMEHKTHPRLSVSPLYSPGPVCARSMSPSSPIHKTVIPQIDSPRSPTSILSPSPRHYYSDSLSEGLSLRSAREIPTAYLSPTLGSFTLNPDRIEEGLSEKFSREDLRLAAPTSSPGPENQITLSPPTLLSPSPSIQDAPQRFLTNYDAASLQYLSRSPSPPLNLIRRNDSPSRDIRDIFDEEHIDPCKASCTNDDASSEDDYCLSASPATSHRCSPVPISDGPSGIHSSTYGAHTWIPPANYHSPVNEMPSLGFAGWPTWSPSASYSIHPHPEQSRSASPGEPRRTSSATSVESMSSMKVQHLPSPTFGSPSTQYDPVPTEEPSSPKDLVSSVLSYATAPCGQEDVSEEHRRSSIQTLWEDILATPSKSPVHSQPLLHRKFVRFESRSCSPSSDRGIFQSNSSTLAYCLTSDIHSNSNSPDTLSPTMNHGRRKLPDIPQTITNSSLHSLFTNIEDKKETETLRNVPRSGPKLNFTDLPPIVMLNPATPIQQPSQQSQESNHSYNLPNVVRFPKHPLPVPPPKAMPVYREHLDSWLKPIVPREPMLESSKGTKGQWWTPSSAQDVRKKHEIWKPDISDIYQPGIDGAWNNLSPVFDFSWGSHKPSKPSPPKQPTVPTVTVRAPCENHYGASKVHDEKPPITPTGVNTGVAQCMLKPCIFYPSQDQQIFSPPRYSPQPNTPTAPPQILHPKFWLLDGSITFRVDRTLYKVHRYFFEQHSAYFRTLLQSYTYGQGCEPIHLADITTIEFDRLLTLFYPTNFMQSDLVTLDEWTSILALSTKWVFTNIREVAISKLARIASAVDKIVLGKEYHVHDWLAPSYRELCLKGTPLDHKEAERLGLQDAMRIWQLQHELFWMKPRNESGFAGMSREIDRLVLVHFDLEQQIW